MKRILWLVAIAAAVWGLPRLSHPAMDIGKLEPVETVLLEIGDAGIRIETDSGAKGAGTTLEDAIRDLRDSAASEIYLDTTNKLLILGNAEAYWPEIRKTFRPSCGICTVEGPIDLRAASEYLSVHKPKVTLNHIWAGEKEWQTLMITEGRGQLVPG